MSEEGGGSSFGGGPALNAHGDVLNATAETPEEVERLVTELKTRGNAAFKVRQLPTAVTLYSKALEHDPKAHAIFGNRSMSQLAMGKFEEALEDADAAIAISEEWAKGHFRRAKALTALDRHAAALGAIRRAVELAPDDKSLKKEEAACATKAAEAKEAAKKAKEAKDAEPEKFWGEDDREAKDAATAPAPAEPKAKPKPAPKKKEAAPAENSTAEEEDEEQIRGYKILADGRKTSFFDHQMSEEEKLLLGYERSGDGSLNLKPKQLTAEEIKALEDKTKSNAGEGSVWAGNTWEDRKMNSWAEAKLRELAGPCMATIGEDTIAVKEVESFTGTASIYVKQGKKKYFYDLTFKLKWEIKSLDASGTLEYKDIVQDDVEDADVTPTIKLGSNTKDAVRKLVKALQVELLQALTNFNTEFLQC